MKLKKYGLVYQVATLSIVKTVDINIGEQFNKNSIPILRDIIDPNNFELDSGRFRNDFIEIEVQDFNGYGAVMQHDNGVFYETILSRWISLLLRRAHLIKVSEGLSMSYVGKSRVQHEIEDLDHIINDISKNSCLIANIVLRVVDMSGAHLVWQGVDPISALLGNAITQNRKEYIDAPSLLNFTNQGLPDSAFNQIMTELSDKISAEKKLLLPPKLFGGTVDFANSTISINTKVLKFLCNNRHLLASCADTVFNLLLIKEDYSSNELFSRGTQLKSILYEMSVRFPFLRDSKINKRDIYTSTGDILCAIYETDAYSDFVIDDVNLLSIKTTSQSLSTMYRTLTKVQVLSLCHLGQRLENGRLTFANSSYIEFEDDAFIRMLEAKFDLISNVVSACNTITAVAMCGLKINSSNSQQFSLDIRNFFIRLDPNFHEDVND